MCWRKRCWTQDWLAPWLSIRYREEDQRRGNRRRGPKKIVVEELNIGPWLALAKSVVFKEVVGHVVTKAPDAFAVSLVVNGVGRSKDYLIWRWCDSNNGLHRGLALRTKQTMRRVCSEQCSWCRSYARILNCYSFWSLCGNGMSWTRWRDSRERRRWSAWPPTVTRM